MANFNAMAQNKSLQAITTQINDSPALPGQPLSLKIFRNWVREAENEPSVDLETAKAQWEKKKKQLLRLTK